jgi:hypothetical protein
MGDKVQGKILMDDRHLPINLRRGFRNESSARLKQALIRVKISFPDRLNGIKSAAGAAGRSHVNFMSSGS